MMKIITVADPYQLPVNAASLFLFIKTTIMNQRDFLIELGKLLYAIASSDGDVRLQENRKLRDILRTDFIAIAEQTDHLGRTNFEYAELELEWMEENYVNPKVAFTSFINFIKEHSAELNEGQKDSILKAAEEVADSFYKRNHYEEHFLHKLKNALKKK
jgi:uncharacterized tellurite resistance protein B-like protein